MKKIIMSLLFLAFPALCADDAQIEASCKALVDELETVREKNENISAHQEAFAAFVDLTSFCEQKKTTLRAISEKKLRKLGLLDENGNIKQNVCQIMNRINAQAEEKENK